MESIAIRDLDDMEKLDPLARLPAEAGLAGCADKRPERLATFRSGELS